MNSIQAYEKTLIKKFITIYLLPNFKPALECICIKPFISNLNKDFLKKIIHFSL